MCDVSCLTSDSLTSDLLSPIAGGFGVVDLVTDMRTNQEFVLKRCNIDREESFETARKEINMLQQFKGTHVAELLGMYHNNRHNYTQLY
jgi:hypothetical protein